MRRRCHSLRLLALAAALVVGGCYMRDLRWVPVRPPSRVPPEALQFEITGYCKCGHCCGWERNWLGRPVIAAGPNRGRPKQVGITASGTRARLGTIAADTSRFPFGTVMQVPGYGYGVVEDRGSAIQGNRIDLYFRSHQEAKVWGRQRLAVKVWLPPRPE